MGLPNLVRGGVFQVLFHDPKLLPEFELNWDISRIILDRTGEGMNAFMLDEVDLAPRLKSKLARSSSRSLAMAASGWVFQGTPKGRNQGMEKNDTPPRT